MVKWLTRLEVRLLIGFAIVLAIVLGSVSVSTRIAASAEAARFQEELERVRTERVQEIVETNYTRFRGFRDVQQMLEEAGRSSTGAWWSSTGRAASSATRTANFARGPTSASNRSSAGAST